MLENDTNAMKERNLNAMVRKEIQEMDIKCKLKEQCNEMQTKIKGKMKE